MSADPKASVPETPDKPPKRPEVPGKPEKRPEAPGKPEKPGREIIGPPVPPSAPEIHVPEIPVPGPDVRSPHDPGEPESQRFRTRACGMTSRRWAAAGRCRTPPTGRG